MESRAFLCWLAANYPKIFVEATVYQEPQAGNLKRSDSLSRLTINGLPYDNLYIDMKWIIHPYLCTEAKLLQPRSMTFQELLLHVYADIDRLYSIVRPRKLLYLAVDGVLPRLKMNMHRAHCFQAAKNAASWLSTKEGNLSEELGTLAKVPPFKKNNELCDPNAFAPGTEFMATLIVALKYYVCLRINHNPQWQNIKVVLSDASVPGDAKDKIMSYIRLQRDLQCYDANTHHCLFGLDLDSLMMALATHEVHFSILHENPQALIYHTAEKNLDHTTQRSCSVGICNVDEKIEQDISITEDNKIIVNSEKSYQFLHIWILREYLENDLCIPDAPVKINFEQFIDDFVFLGLLAASNFLPHMPFLDIQEEPMMLLMNIYKKEYVKMGGYLTFSGEANLRCVEHFMQAMGTLEDDFIQKRQSQSKTDLLDSCTATVQNTMAKDSKVKVAELSWKERYYTAKFQTLTAETNEDLKKEVVLKYTEGLCWILRYYYHGVCSWQWYYPYYDAPLASDLKDLEDLEINFFLGKPLKPLDYLIGILPVSSAHLLPELYKPLMTDPNSPIRDFLQDIEGDTCEKHSTSSGVASLPFVEETRLLAETSKIEQIMQEFERKSNHVGSDFLFLSRSHPLSSYILYAHDASGVDQHGTQIKEINPTFSEGMNGFVILCNDLCPPSVVSVVDKMGDITNNHVLCVPYKGPTYHRHRARLMEGVIIPTKVDAKKEAMLDIPRSLEADIDEPDRESMQLLQKDVKNQVSSFEETFHQLHKQVSICGCESLPGILSSESSPNLTVRRAGPPGFEQVVPGLKIPIGPGTWGQTRTPNGSLISSKSLPYPMDNSSQYQQGVIEVRSLSPVITSSLNPKRTLSGNVRPPINQVPISNNSPNRNPDQGYNVPAFIHNAVGSSANQSHPGPKKSATKSIPTSQVARSVSQYPGLTPSSPNVSPNKNIANSYNRTGESSEFLGVHSVSQYPQIGFPPGGYSKGNFPQIMPRPSPTAATITQGFTGFSRGPPEAQYVHMSPLNYTQQPARMPPRVWYKERELEASPPPRTQQIGAGNHPVMDTRPGSFARSRGTGIRHPDDAYR